MKRSRVLVLKHLLLDAPAGGVDAVWSIDALTDHLNSLYGGVFSRRQVQLTFESFRDLCLHSGERVRLVWYDGDDWVSDAYAILRFAREHEHDVRSRDDWLEIISHVESRVSSRGMSVRAVGELFFRLLGMMQDEEDKP